MSTSMHEQSVSQTSVTAERLTSTMIYHKPNPTSGAMKRSASALETPPGWGVAPPMMTSRSSFHVPFAHYALIYLDDEGKLKVDESPSIEDQNSTMFTPNVRQKFLENLDKHQLVVRSFRRRVRRRRGNATAFVTDDCLADNSGNDDESPSGDNEATSIRVGDTLKLMNYYECALKHFQQLNCRMVAKAFIKFIEPRKQARHPYNGGKPPVGSPSGTTGDPEKTKPEWWPPGVMHKEPDHLRTEHRIELLLHIIRKLEGHGITADKLREVAEDTKRSLKHPFYMDIILEILRVRKMEERWEHGEVDSNTLVYVMYRGPSPKSDEEESTDGPAMTVDAPENIEEGVWTPSSSIQQAPLIKPIHTTGVPPRFLPRSFSLSQPLAFEGQQDRSFYTTPPQYIDSFPQDMLNTPVMAENITPHGTSVCDYPSQTHFPTSPPDQQLGGAPGQYDSWSKPYSPQHTFSPMTSSVPAATYPLPQPSTPYNMAIASPAHFHALSSHGQSTMEPINQQTLPFRTRSMGHIRCLPLSHPE